MVRTFFVVVILAASIVVVSATQALACSCVAPRPDREAAKDAAAVFTGTVVDAEVRDPGGRGAWTFAVDTVYVGDVSEDQIVHSHTQSAACGFLFEEGKRYAVFAFEGDESMAADAELSTNLCMNTRALRDGRELELEPIADFEAQPDEEESTPGPGSSTEDGVSIWIAIAIGVTGLGAGLFWWMRTLRRSSGAPGTPTDPL